VNVLGVDELCRERTAFLGTVEPLGDDDFENGTTLCDGWAPRDVLAHLVGTADLANYMRHGLRVSAANAVAVTGGASSAVPS